MLSSDWHRPTGPVLATLPFKQNVRLSNPAHQNQDQKDDNHKAQSATAVVAGPIEGTASNPAKTTKQDDDQDNEQDRSEGHGLISFVNKMGNTPTNRVVPSDQ